MATNAKEQDSWLLAADLELVPVSSSITNTVVDAFPKGEHSSLAAAKKRTQLRVIFKFINCDLNQFKDLDNRAKAKQHAANARTFRLPHRKISPGPTRRLELWWQDLLPMVAKHVLALQQELQTTTRVDHGLFSADSNEIGQLSLGPAERAEKRLHGVVNKLVADAPLAPGAHEDDAVDAYSLAKQGLLAKPTGADPSALRAFELLVLEVKRSLTRFRELLNHDLIWTMGSLCHKEVVEQFRLIQKKHIMENSRRVANGDEPILFTAEPLYKYLEDECSVDNTVLLQGCESVVRRYYRKNGVTPAQWLESYAAPLEEIRALRGGTDLTPDQASELWKLTWGSNINAAEYQLMMLYKDRELKPSEWKKIQDFAKGEFDTDIMTNFLVIMAPIFRDAPAGPFTPDNAVKTYNRTHYRDKLKLDPSTIQYAPQPAVSAKKRLLGNAPAARNPNGRGRARGRGANTGHRDGRGRGTGHNVRSPRGPQTSLLSRVKVPFHSQCKTPSCRASVTKTFENHTTANCRFKTLPDGGNRNSTHVPQSSRTNPQRGGGGRGTGKGRGRGAPKRCRFCNEVHPFGKCPLLDKRKLNAPARAQRLKESPQFGTKLRQYFNTQEELDVVSQIAMHYDLLNICQRCVDKNCNGFCNPSAKRRKLVARVRQIIGENADDIGNSIRIAINDNTEYHDPDNERAVMAPMNAESFFTHCDPHEGHGVEEDHDPLMTQSIFTDTPHQDTSILDEDYSISPEENQCFTNEDTELEAEESAYTHKGADLNLGMPYEEGNEGEDIAPQPNPNFDDHFDHQSEDQVGNYMHDYHHS